MPPDTRPRDTSQQPATAGSRTWPGAWGAAHAGDPGAISARGSGWPSEVLAKQSSEAALARRWIEQQQKRERNEPSEPDTAQSYGPSMPSREALEILEGEAQDLGKHHSLKAFEKALNRAAGRARKNPDLLPVPLGGQHNDWQLVSIGAGGHHGGHMVRRQLSQ